jgi:hypothetical protein
MTRLILGRGALLRRKSFLAIPAAFEGLDGPARGPG